MAPQFSAKLPKPHSTWLRTPGVSQSNGFYYGVWAPVRGVYTKGYAVSNVKAKRRATASQSFRIGSITKTFTAVAVLILADRGRVNLDKPVATYVHGLGKLPGGRTATVREVLNMTSGFADYTVAGTSPFAQMVLDPQRVWTPQEVIDYAATQSATPRGKFNYSSTNYVILGELVTNVSHVSLGRFVKRKILTPLKLKHTIIPSPTVTAPVASHGYINASWDEFTPPPSQQIQDAFTPGLDVTKWSTSIGGAAGNGVSTLRDLARWGASDFGNSLLSPKLRAERLTMVNGGTAFPGSGYGLGIESINGWHFHSGEILGRETVLFANPTTHQVVVASANACCGMARSIFTRAAGAFPVGLKPVADVFKP
jgi:D-alanyl-D-alanine carboxypeptidase